MCFLCSGSALQQVYSTASDVWSFGAVLYEIWSLGQKPFEEIGNREVSRADLKLTSHCSIVSRFSFANDNLANI